ncbi:50S ribosomal protein L13 [bioreactor metagenome]|uniref:50S ribosomal protein L13 n=1 Tax=bioreactor metagenome TaxID=1076179 RepID=A0A644T7X8_9ZZZZ|nr:50S ribosomal protein L13 [Candidatus Elulimicrobiales bacterium]
MTNTKETKEYIIDASGKALGRLSSEVASILNAKNSPSFAKNIVAPVKVKVINASKIKLTGKKMDNSVHKTYSGHPGGQKVKTLSTVAERKGYSELVRHAVEGMLPKNRLQDKRMKNLLIEE